MDSARDEVADSARDEVVRENGEGGGGEDGWEE
jgi:hypothetical protein